LDSLDEGDEKHKYGVLNYRRYGPEMGIDPGKGQMAFWRRWFKSSQVHWKISERRDNDYKTM